MVRIKRHVIFQPARLLRPVLCACVVGGGLQVLSLTQPVAHASVGPCATDPLFIFSNGTELDVDTVITDISADVQQAVFTIHVPTGTSLVAYVAGALGAKESWRVLADAAPGNYTTVTDVHAATQGIEVQATTQITGVLGAVAAVVEGQANQDLTAQATL
jgi:hypothetical protein